MAASLAILFVMPYIISFSNPAGAASVRRDTPKEALNHALELAGKGFQNVTILDENGKAYAIADFAKFFADTRK
jgi:hypothetical protein